MELKCLESIGDSGGLLICCLIHEEEVQVHVNWLVSIPVFVSVYKLYFTIITWIFYVYIINAVLFLFFVGNDERKID